MDANKLKAQLKANKDSLTEHHAVRLHRAISWLKCAEDVKDNLDIQYISL